jgi:hypothetical protein
LGIIALLYVSSLPLIVLLLPLTVLSQVDSLIPQFIQTYTDSKGKFVIIKDLAVILPDTVLPEGTVVPSFSVWSGNPGTFPFPILSSSET